MNDALQRQVQHGNATPVGAARLEVRIESHPKQAFHRRCTLPTHLHARAKNSSQGLNIARPHGSERRKVV